MSNQQTQKKKIPKRRVGSTR